MKNFSEVYKAMAYNNEQTKPVRYEVTPEIAARWLAAEYPAGIKQRSLRPSAVAQHAAAMARGQWYSGVGTIVLGPGDCVLDGQHRLHALIRSKHTLFLDVVFNAPPEVMTVLDTGLGRSSGDIHNMLGGSRGTKVVAVTNGLILMLAGNKGHNKSYAELKPIIETHAERIDWALSNYPDRVYPSVNSGCASVRASWVFLLACGVSKDTIKEFIDQLVTGAATEDVEYSSRAFCSALTRVSSGVTSDRLAIARAAVHCLQAHSQKRKIKVVREHSVELPAHLVRTYLTRYGTL